MFIRITRLILITIIAVFLGMCIVWIFLYVADNKPTGMLKFGIAGSIILIGAILGLQFWENRKEATERKRLEDKQQRENLIKEKEEIAKERAKLEAEKQIDKIENTTENTDVKS